MHHMLQTQDCLVLLRGGGGGVTPSICHSCFCCISISKAGYDKTLIFGEVAGERGGQQLPLLTSAEFAQDYKFMVLASPFPDKFGCSNLYIFVLICGWLYLSWQINCLVTWLYRPVWHLFRVVISADCKLRGNIKTKTDFIGDSQMSTPASFLQVGAPNPDTEQQGMIAWFACFWCCSVVHDFTHVDWCRWYM